MKILHLSSVYAPHAVGGAEKVVELLAEGMAARGHQVAVTSVVPEATAPTLRHGVELRPLAHRNPLWIQDSARHPAPVRQLNKIATLFNAFTAADFARVLDEVRPDIVHSHSMVELTPWMWRAVRARGAVLVHTLHDYDLLCIRAALFMHGRRCEGLHRACGAFSSVKRRHHVHIAHVVGVSQAILRTHLEHGLFAHLPAERRHVIWNPVHRAPGPAPARPAVPQQKPFTFGFLGRLVAEKGIEVLLQACRGLLGAGVGGWQLKVAGRAPGDDAALRAAMEGLPVERVGFVEPMAFLRDIDVLVVPSVWREPFGLTVVEAYAAGVPVIGADSGGIAEIVGAVDPSALVPAGDASALARRMAGFVRAGRGALSAVDATALLEQTRPEAVVERYLQLYARALAPRSLSTRDRHGPARRLPTAA
ncbi:glycosyltransferase family 4 protein [uncultured Azohydromonas sp.]|uniref:glycosyltransferase family 4 protein n=1 Tax=uncultured Azohydromonas sp. TaxID=487342 RepID=UPI00262F76A2|nr:glycosyltransferase family 4 protein [uncultured Azohydromonas sp.]